MIDKIIYKLTSPFVGRKAFQNFFKHLYDLSLRGLNYGNGGDFKVSGELNVLKFIANKFKSDQHLVVFDVGGNVGNYSKELALFFKNRATIHAFEPSKKTYEVYLETTKGIDTIVPNNCGLSDQVQNQLLYTNEDASGLASVYQRKLDHFGIAMDKSEEIVLSTIDNYCKQNKIEQIHFLKLDIEGHELKALKGAREMISSKKLEVIQFEFGGCNIDSRTYFQDFYYLLKEDFRIYRILKNGLIEIKNYRETEEVFMTVIYLAVKK